MEFVLYKNSGLNPSIVSCLKSIPIDAFSYRYYELRHPGAIYNLMVNKLIGRLNLLTNEVKEKRTDKIKRYFRLVLHDFFQFYESCYEIMVCFCKQHELPVKNEFLNKWLKNNKYSIEKYFYESVKDEINELKILFNKLKHTSNDIQFITFRNTTEITIGYWLDTPRESKKPLHPISLNFEIRRLYYLIYFISEKLEEALNAHLLKIFQVQLTPYDHEIKDNTFKELFKNVDSLSNFYLLNEIGKPVHKSFLAQDSIVFEKEIISEALFDKYYADGINLEMILTSDGYSNTATVPYCGINQIGQKFFYKTKDQTLKELRII